MADRPAETAETAAIGLGETEKRAWPKAPEPGQTPLELLTPGSTLHSNVLAYLIKRLELAEEKISQLYPRWRIAEQKLQAYISLNDYEQQLKAQNNKAKPAQAVSIVVPYSFATHQTFVTYLLHTFAGRKPLFQVSSYNPGALPSTHAIETFLQYNADHTRLLKWLYQHFQDSLTYGLGILKTKWQIDKKLRTNKKAQPANTFFGAANPQLSIREPVVVYSGNAVEAVDPFMFFPDPRVPMTEVNKRGEFVFWRCFEGRHILKRMEYTHPQSIRYVDAASQKLPQARFSTSNGESSRAMLSAGDAMPGSEQDARGARYYQVDQGTVEIIPAELGLGESTIPTKYLFTILNKSQIIQAEPLEADHDMHPVAVTEPYSMGYGFGNPGLLDYMAPIQDTMSWLVNSHIYNVRAALNNMFIVDPSRVEMQDLRNPAPGKIIRLKRAAFGMDVREAIQQLSVADVTQSHLRDTEIFIRLAQYLSGATDNVMGLQEAGGRKTATEVRTAAEAGASRLAALARLISSQSIVDLTEQLVINTQQYLDPEFAVRVLGEPEAAKLSIGDALSGDFSFPVSDGTLPLDKVALLDVWKEIFLAVAQNPQLSQVYNAVKIFEWTAELGGARNIAEFRINPAMDATVAGQAQAGNLVPATEAAPAGAPAPLTQKRIPNSFSP